MAPAERITHRTRARPGFTEACRDMRARGDPRGASTAAPHLTATARALARDHAGAYADAEYPRRKAAAFVRTNVEGL